ncbi:MAG: hypothetical protein DMG07_03380 [Acidobacteria bacterium]|nr:MAG: hypothetical protein DMG07_03380 [Acidobacteriota bacterium]
MKASQKSILVGLVILVAAAVAGLVLTRTSPDSEAPGEARRAPAAGREPVIDKRTLETAQKLAALAVTPEEQQLAHDAQRLADHESDLAFADALRLANEQPGPQGAESRDTREPIRQIELQIKANEETVKQLTAQAASAEGSDRDRLPIQIELVKAELALAQDELADAKEDLIRAGGDAYSKLQRLLEEHEAMQHANGTVRLNSGSGGAAETVFSPDSLIAKWRDWSALREKQGRLLQARQDALSKAAALSKDHETLEQHVRGEQSQKQELAQQAASLLKVGKTESPSKQAAAAALSSLRHLSEDEKHLLGLDKRAQDLRQLSAIYGQWSALVETGRRASLHVVIKSVLWIVLTALIVFLAGRLVDKSFTRVNLERKQQTTLRAIVRFTVHVLAAVVILLVIFGSPRQMSTILGLAGAGLTVALKDFIVSFLGWFVLMGRNGIRVGDWVEINGVRGEVIEVGLLRTVLLETDNWTSPGHPTGRQVAFLNSFAVEGYYFNFTTSGQWLWDEIQLLIPWSVEPYAIIDKISEILTKETERNAQTAEQEWKRVTRRYGVRPFSPTPAVNVRSTKDGMEVIARYIARAHERSELRSRLSHALVRLIHPGKAVSAATGAPPIPSGAGQGEIAPDQPPDR